MTGQTTVASPLRCALVDGSSAFLMVKGEWRSKEPIAKLPGYIALYRRLRDRADGKYAAHYAQPTEALEALAVKAGIPLPKPAQKGAAKK